MYSLGKHKFIFALTMAIAHVKNENGQWLEHNLHKHLNSVAQLAKKFAENFGANDLAYLAGLWHDLGKFSQDFQCHIKRKSGYDPEARSENGNGKVDHSTAGAFYAKEKLRQPGQLLTFLIAGHHVGLPDWNSGNARSRDLKNRLKKGKNLLQHALDSKENIDQNILQPNISPDFNLSHLSFPALWIRMLFSCLVDADFLDTESFMNEKRFQKRARWQSLSELAPKFENYIRNKLKKVEKTKLNEIRRQILQECYKKAKEKPGIFSLQVPTGGGKTLSSLAFALTHALEYKKQRIIYVIPYTSIIEQTADIFRDIFGNQIIEHHCNLNPEKETLANDLACENWDAPLIVTTNVQFFESLFACRTSQTRKLHNIVNSVIILDEAQMLPAEFLNPILESLNSLAKDFSASIIVSTATQPAFSPVKTVSYDFKGLPDMQPIIDNPQPLYQQLKRVNYTLPVNLNQSITWENLAQELQQYEQVLCIVNRRDDCRNLYRLMPQGTYHLSALMCGEHRSKVIAEITQELKNKKSIRVISTQLVEAGVDLDFPVVYRAFAGLDAIVQAAGRCNREGLSKRGKVVVFVPPTKPPRGLQKPADVTRTLLNGYKEKLDLYDPEIFNHFFNGLYWLCNNLDTKKIIDSLSKYNFRTAAENFKLIDDNWSATVIVQYGDAVKYINKLKNEGIQKWLLRKLQRYTVTIPKNICNELLSKHDVELILPNLYAQVSENLYHVDLGFLGNRISEIDPKNYIV